MKTKFFLLLIAMMAMTFVACDKKDQPQDPTENRIDETKLVGLWGVTKQESDDPAFLWYCFLTEDGKAGQFAPMSGDVQYYECYFGSYTVQDSTVALHYNPHTIYFNYNAKPCIAYMDKKHWGSSWELLSVSANKLHIRINKSIYYLYKLDKKPEGWQDVFFEEEKPVSQDALIGQWDHKDFFIINNDGSFSWWAYDYPEMAGMALQADGKFQSVYFADWIVTWCRDNTQHPESWGCIWNVENMSWDLLQNTTLNFYCTSVDIAEMNDEGEEVPGTRYTVTPSSPITESYKVFYLTEHFMILNTVGTNYYYVFAPGTRSASSAPQFYVPSLPVNLTNPVRCGTASPANYLGY